MKNYTKESLTVLFIEFMERFSFYGSRSLLIFYMTSELLIKKEMSIHIYSTFMALAWAVPMIGGWIGDRFTGRVTAMNIGLCLGAAAALFLMMPSDINFYIGLSLYVLASGLFKANCLSFFGRLYNDNNSHHDSDAAFTYFYLAVNIGSLLGIFLCGFLGQKFGWSYGFGLASLISFLGACTSIYARKSLLVHDTQQKHSVWKKILLCVGMVLCGISVFSILKYPYFMDIIMIFTAIFAAYLWALVMYRTPEKRRALCGALGLMLLNIFFFALFEQSGGSLNLFADSHLDRWIFGCEIPASTLQSLNPLFIMGAAPLFAHLWNFLQKKKMNPPYSRQFGVALVLIGSGLLMMFLVIGQFAEAGRISFLWFALAMFITALGELTIAPIGLSMITKIAPTQYAGRLTAIWFLSYAFANHLGGIIGRFLVASPSSSLDTLVSLETYANAFWTLGGLTAALGSVVLIFSFVGKKWVPK